MAGARGGGGGGGEEEVEEGVDVDEVEEDGDEQDDE